MTANRSFSRRMRAGLPWLVLGCWLLILQLGVAVHAESAGAALVLEKKPGVERTLQLILNDAPGGVHMFDVTVSVRDTGIARIQSARGVAISGFYFQVLWAVKTTDEDSIRFRALDSDQNNVSPGDHNVVLAEIDIVDLRPGQTEIDVTVNSFVDDWDYSAFPQVTSTLYEVHGSAPAPERLPVAVSTEPVKDSLLDSSHVIELPSIGGAAKPPRDLDDDGLYEDIDGDGELTPEDVSLFAFEIYGDVIQSHVERFAFNDDGKIDLEDIRALVALVHEADLAPAILRLGHGIGETGEEVVLDLLLGQGVVRGLQTYDLTLSTSDPSVAEISGVTSTAINPKFFQVVRHDPRSITFRAADFTDEIRPGADDIVLATIIVAGVNNGDATIDITVDAMTDDEGNSIDPVVQSGSVTITVLLSPIGDSPYPPQDLNNDGLYEDVNGDGRLTYADPLLLVFNLDSKAIQDNPGLFDSNGDGIVDFDDSGDLAMLVEEVE